MTIIYLIYYFKSEFLTVIVTFLLQGGFALLATTSTALGGPAATASILPLLLAPLGVVGVVGTAGLTIMAMSECGGPMLCVSPSGQCCFLNLMTGACPESC